MHSKHSNVSNETKFLRNVTGEPNTGCWLWLGHLTECLKYGRFSVGRRRYMAHHFSYETYVGKIPRGMELHHTCNVGWCVNPGHLVPMPKEENVKIRNSYILPTFRPYASNRKAIREHSIIGRLVERVSIDATNGCWVWQGATNGKYGVFTSRHRIQGYAHRASYEAFIGSIPNGMEIDHSCVTPLCINPRHLSLVTRKQNIRLAHSRRYGNACRRGHEYTPQNTWVEKNGYRRCRRCHADREAANRARKKECA